LRQAEQDIRLPAEVNPNVRDLRPVACVQHCLRRHFSVVEVPGNGPEADLLRGTLHTLATNLTSGPVAVPVFGRARALSVLMADTLTQESILDVCVFLCGACSCMVKAMNPGVDLFRSHRLGCGDHRHDPVDEIPAPLVVPAATARPTRSGRFRIRRGRMRLSDPGCTRVSGLRSPRFAGHGCRDDQDFAVDFAFREIYFGMSNEVSPHETGLKNNRFLGTRNLDDHPSSHRPGTPAPEWHALLSLLAVAAAVACLLGAVVLLRAFDRRTEALVAARESDVAAQMSRMEDDYRKITKRMGFTC